MCDCVSESEWISIEELSDLVGIRPFERGEEDGYDGMCGLGLGDGDVNGCWRGKESRFHNVSAYMQSVSSNPCNQYPQVNIPFVSNKESNPLFDESNRLPCDYE